MKAAGPAQFTAALGVANALGASQLTIPAGSLVAGSYAFTMTVARGAQGVGTRTASDSLTLTLVDGLAPVVAIAPLNVPEGFSQAAVQPSLPLQLQCSGTLGDGVTPAASFEWQATDARVTSGLGLANVLSSLIDPTSCSSTSQTLLIPALALTAAGTYAFTCCSPSCGAALSGRAVYNLVTVSPPSSGSAAASSLDVNSTTTTSSGRRLLNTTLAPIAYVINPATVLTLSAKNFVPAPAPVFKGKAAKKDVTTKTCVPAL